MKNKGDIKTALKGLFIYKRQIAFILSLTVLTAIIGAIIPYLIGKIIDDAIIYGNLNALIVMVFILFTLQILNELLNAIRQYVGSKTSLEFSKSLRSNLTKKLLYSKFTDVNKYNKGNIIQTTIEDTDIIQTFSLETIPHFFYQILLALVSLYMIFNIYWLIGLLTTLIYLIYLIPVNYFGKIQRKIIVQLRSQSSKLKQMILERLETIRLIKTLRTEDHEYSKVYKEQKKWGNLVISRYVTEHVFRNFPRVFDALVPALVYIIGGFKVFQGTLSIGNLVAIVAYLPAINAPLRSFSQVFLSLKDTLPRLEKISSYLKLTEEKGEGGSRLYVDKLYGEISFNNIVHETERGTLIKGISIHISPGEHVAIVGPSGSGKSSLLKILTGFFEISEGCVLIDNIEINKLDIRSLRNRISYVEQDIFLFNDSLENNIKYMIEDYDKDLLEEYIEHLGIREIINSVKSNSEEIKENGSNLSGGQRQCVGILRALLQNGDILLLDESTSAMNEELQKQIISSLRKIMDGRTILMVSHRLDAIKNFDKIVVLNKGEIDCIGKHSYLLNNSKVYKEMWINEKREGKFYVSEAR